MEVLSCNSHTGIRFGRLAERIAPRTLEYTLGVDLFLRHFPNPAPAFSGTAATAYPTRTGHSPWKRTFRWDDGHGPRCLDLLCCPEDVACDRDPAHAEDEVCER
eukprot:6871983-Pyramimonas_sp.AAC.1